jgi:hypothetical protein
MSKSITQKQCKVELCSSKLSKDRHGNPYLKNGYCQKHYLRQYHYGDININKRYEQLKPRPAIKEENYYKIPLGPGAKHGYALVDENYKCLDKYKWSIDTDGYAITTITINRRKKVLKMHRLVLNPPYNLQVDHINRDRVDNRSNNLRSCTNIENQQNKGDRSPYSKSHK